MLSFLSFGEAGKARFLTKLWNKEIKLLWTPERITTEVKRIVQAEKDRLDAEIKSPRSFPGFKFTLSRPWLQHDKLEDENGGVSLCF